MSWPFQPLLAASAQQQAITSDVLPAAAGLFEIGGGSAAIGLARRRPGDFGEFTMIGGGARLVRARRLSAAAGGIQITGTAIGSSSQDGPRWRDLGLWIGL